MLVKVGQINDKLILRHCTKQTKIAEIDVKVIDYGNDSEMKCHTKVNARQRPIRPSAVHSLHWSTETDYS